MSRPSKAIWFLFVLCLVEWALFARTTAAFFDGDSFYYFPYRVTHLSDMAKYFTALDPAKQYRPMTHAFFSFILFPLLGLRAPLYGFASIAFHLLNTVLVFFLIRRLTRSDLAAAAGAAFWGLNPVAIFITHGICFLADYFYGFFYLLSILSFLRYRETHRLDAGLLTVVSFVIALFTKEAAVTLPLMIGMLTIILFAAKTARVSIASDAGKWVGLSLFIILFVYLLSYYNLKGGAFYDQGATDNYRFVPTMAALKTKLDALAAGLYFPFQKYPLRHPRMAQLLIAALLAPMASLGVFTLWSLARRQVLVISGLLWFFIALLPVLFIVPTEFIHNMYIPLIGVAWIAGLFVDRLTAYIAAKRPYAPVEYLWASLFFVIMLSLLVNQDIFKTKDWRPYYERVARNCIEGLQRLHPTLAPNTILHFLPSDESLNWFLYNGKMINVFYNDASLRSQFGDRDALPEEAMARGRALILGYCNDRVYDVTQDYLADSKRAGFDLLEELPYATVSFNRNEIYPNYENLETPGNKPVFLAPIAWDNKFRMTMITIAGGRVSFALPTLTSRSKLEVGVAMRLDQGDGAEGRISFEHAGGRELLYDRYLHPQDRQWVDDVIDLGRFAGQTGRLLFECGSGPKGDTAGDWFGWSGLHITNTRGNTTGGAYQSMGQKPRLNLTESADAALVQTRNRRFLFSKATHIPSNSPIFYHKFTRDGLFREALITTAGSSLTFYLRDLRPDLSLRVVTGMPFDKGAGARGRILLIDGTQRRVVYSKALTPGANPADRHWFEEVIALQNPAIEDARLVLESTPTDSPHVDGAWFAWHRVELY